MEEHPLRAALAVDPDRWGSLPAALRGAILRLFEQSPARSAGRDLGRLVSTPWFSALTPEDRLRAVKVVAALSAGIAVPGLSASLAYYDSYRSARLPQNLTQAQRDASLPWEAVWDIFWVNLWVKGLVSVASIPFIYLTKDRHLAEA